MRAEATVEDEKNEAVSDLSNNWICWNHYMAMIMSCESEKAPIMSLQLWLLWDNEKLGRHAPKN